MWEVYDIAFVSHRQTDRRDREVEDNKTSADPLSLIQLTIPGRPGAPSVRLLPLNVTLDTHSTASCKAPNHKHHRRTGTQFIKSYSGYS